jgi:hypothetical protein
MKFSIIHQRYVSKAEASIVNNEVRQWAIGGALLLCGFVAAFAMLAHMAPK